MTYFAVIGGILLIGLILFSPLPPWAVLITVMVLAAVAVMAARWINRGVPDPSPSGPEAPSPPPPPPPETERHETQVDGVPLPSAQQGYDFLFSARVIWTPIRGSGNGVPVNREGIAADDIVRRAREFTWDRPPVHAMLVQYELGGLLGVMSPDPRQCVEAMAESIQITLAQPDREHLERLAKAQKERAIWEYLREYEQDRREYFGNDVLKDLGSAVVWLFDKNSTAVPETVEHIEPLRRLTIAANDKGVPAPPLDPLDSVPPPGNGRVSPVDHYAAYLKGLSLDGAQEMTLTNLNASLLKASGRADIADEIRARLSSPPPPEESPGPADSTADGRGDESGGDVEWAEAADDPADPDPN